MISILIYVTFIVVMILWALATGPGGAGYPSAGKWLPWIAVLLLGIAVFITGYWPTLQGRM
jgi:hypothetical protein